MPIIKVDKSKCIGCGACASICPKNFEMREGKAEVKNSQVEKADCEKDAQESCPVDAIEIK